MSTWPTPTAKRHLDSIRGSIAAMRKILDEAEAMADACEHDHSATQDGMPVSGHEWRLAAAAGRAAQQIIPWGNIIFLGCMASDALDHGGRGFRVRRKTVAPAAAVAPAATTPAPRKAVRKKAAKKKAATKKKAAKKKAPARSGKKKSGKATRK